MVHGLFYHCSIWNKIITLHVVAVFNVETRQSSGIVAFTSYLDHVLSLGDNQPIVFNKIILNDGRGYSNNTGKESCQRNQMFLLQRKRHTYYALQCHI